MTSSAEGGGKSSRSQPCGAPESAAPEVASSGWRPITDDPIKGVAPWDGKPVLIFTDVKWCDARAMARWSDDFHGDGIFGWLVDDNKHGPYPLRGYLNVTHWMPLPPPPDQSADRQVSDAAPQLREESNLQGGDHER